MKKEQETWTVLKVLDWTKGYLAEKGIENARLETEWMLCAALGLDRVGLYVNHDKPLTSDELAVFKEMVARRAKREPLQYILGEADFYGLKFDDVSDGQLAIRQWWYEHIGEIGHAARIQVAIVARGSSLSSQGVN